MPSSQEGLARLIERSGLVDPRIADAFRRVDRAGFVPHDLIGEAYLDRPVPIPHDQTTSQPSLIARMIDSAGIGPQDRVLEVGTGYGFQTALIAELARGVISIERFGSLAETARLNLRRSGLENALVKVGDGRSGAPEEGPYDAMIVSAASDDVPEALVEQLAEGGRLVIPVKSVGSDDVLLFRKTDGRLERVRLVTPARFVPLVRGSDE
ncbi:MAG TPA: protein-L-isoaspartate(D-aspartate) O-methyltransferase [Actinomycetota bacterium]|nr:protein-L-isoaspartate(D-aspartate) O-methyltransferase [Actinomycetota bacterium]